MAGMVEMLPRTYVVAGSTVKGNVVDFGAAVSLVVQLIADATPTGSNAYQAVLYHSNVAEGPFLAATNVATVLNPEVTAFTGTSPVTGLGRFVYVAVQATGVTGYVRVLAVSRDA